MLDGEMILFHEIKSNIGVHLVNIVLDLIILSSFSWLVFYECIIKKTNRHKIELNCA